METKQEKFKDSLKSNDSNRPFLSNLLSWKESELTALQETIENISEWSMIKRMYDQLDPEDKIRWRQKVRDIKTWVDDNYVYPDLDDFSNEVEKFMILHGITPNPVDR